MSSAHDGPLRVLVVTNAFPTPTAPSVGVYVHDHVESLRRAGVIVDLLYLNRREEGPRVYLRLRQRVKDSIATLRPDLVHVMYGGVVAYVVTRVVGDVPVLVSFQGTDLLGGREPGLATRTRRRFSVRLSRLAALRAAGVTAQSHRLAEALPSGLDRSRVWIVSGGVDLDRFAPRDKAACRRQLGWRHADYHVLFPWSPARPEKRFDLAAAAVAELRLRGVEAELHTLGDVAHEEMPVWLNASNVVLLTSTHEGSPNSVKEALACNVPIVSVDVGDLRDRLSGLGGCCIAEASPTSLANGLAYALAETGLFRGRERVAELGLDRVAGRMRVIYEEVAATRANSDA